MDTDYKGYASMMKALGDESRLKIFDMLGNGELCACKVLEEFNITQPTLSYHMKILCDCGLVNGRRDGIWMKYTINKEVYDRLKNFIDHAEPSVSEYCSCGSSNCCPPEHKQKKITIDFLYLDLSVCERCQGTDTNLDQAAKEVSNVLGAAGYDIEINKMNITSEESAVKYRFISSPTIRINGRDIDINARETSCKECGDLCGDEVDCRVWEYEGAEYNEPPVAMIINAIMKEVYGNSEAPSPEETEYVLPDNLKIFFNGKKENRRG